MDRPVTPEEIGEVIELGRWAMPTDGRIKAAFSLDTPCEALAAWFTLHLAEGIDLPTGPHDVMTHWHQTLLPLDLKPGDYLLEAGPAPEDSNNSVLTIDGREVRVR